MQPPSPSLAPYWAPECNTTARAKPSLNFIDPGLATHQGRLHPVEHRQVLNAVPLPPCRRHAPLPETQRLDFRPYAVLHLPMWITVYARVANFATRQPIDARIPAVPTLARTPTPTLALLPCRCKLFAICSVLGISCTLRDFTNLPYHCPIAHPHSQQSCAHVRLAQPPTCPATPLPPTPRAAAPNSEPNTTSLNHHTSPDRGMRARYRASIMLPLPLLRAARCLLRSAAAPAGSTPDPGAPARLQLRFVRSAGSDRTPVLVGSPPAPTCDLRGAAPPPGTHTCIRVPPSAPVAATGQCTGRTAPSALCSPTPPSIVGLPPSTPVRRRRRRRRPASPSAILRRLVPRGRSGRRPASLPAA